MQIKHLFQPSKHKQPSYIATVILQHDNVEFQVAEGVKTILKTMKWLLSLILFQSIHKSKMNIVSPQYNIADVTCNCCTQISSILGDNVTHSDCRFNPATKPTRLFCTFHICYTETKQNRLRIKRAAIML